MTDEELQQGRERWLDMEKMKIALLKSIYLESRLQSSMLKNILSIVGSQEFKSIENQYKDRYGKARQSLADWIYAEFGEVNLKDILPPDGNSTEEERF